MLRFEALRTGWGVNDGSDVDDRGLRDRLARIRDVVVLGGFYRWADAAGALHLQPERAVLVNGFWRSGTTWLQEMTCRALKAKSVFEPFHPRVPEALPLFRAVFDRGLGQKKMFMPYATGSLPSDDHLGKLVRNALVGDLSGVWIRRLRAGLRENFRNRVVVKTVRGSLVLGALAATHAPRVIHLFRDPRAIVASLVRRGSAWGFWRQLSLVEQLLSVEDGRQDWFAQWSEEIRWLDRGSDVQRITAYWALTEERARRDVEELGDAAALLAYEDLCRGKSRTLQAMLRSLGLLDPSSVTLSIDPRRPSDTTHPGRDGISTDRRVSGWKSELDLRTVHEVEATLRLLDLEPLLHPHGD